MKRLQCLRSLAAVGMLAAATVSVGAEGELAIGYTELRTNLPGGRHANVSTMRAAVVGIDGKGRRLLAESLADRPDHWTQFAGWSPDGSLAIVGQGRQSPENARWEEEHKTFRFSPDAWGLDTYLVDIKTGSLDNLSAVDRVSHYNSGLFFWPSDPTKLGFQALIDGDSHPFKMDRNGKNKIDLTKNSKEFAYGFEASPDGRRIAYHKSYKIYLANADGSNAVLIETGNPFNFSPRWSPDGKYVLFVSGEHYDCHPHVVSADGTGLRKIADRAGYRGVTEFLDVPDFHGGSSDVPVWSVDGKSIFFTAREEDGVGLFQLALDGEKKRLSPGTGASRHYHPQPSPDGRYLAYGSMREGARNLYVMRLSDRQETRITNNTVGRGALWPHWRPVQKRLN